MERKNIDTTKITDEQNCHERHHDDDNDDLRCELIPDMPDIPGISPHELPEDLGKIQKSNSIENDKQVTSSSTDMSDDESKTDSGTDDDFKDIDDSLFTNIENYISSITALHKTLPKNPKTDEEIKVKKNDDDFDSEIINNLPEEERSSKSPETTKPELPHNVVEEHLQPIIHSSLGPIQNKSQKNQSEHARYHPYGKKEVNISPQKSLEHLKELNKSCTVSNTATESNAELDIPVKKELLMSPDNKINSARMSQHGTTNDS